MLQDYPAYTTSASTKLRVGWARASEVDPLRRAKGALGVLTVDYAANVNKLVMIETTAYVCDNTFWGDCWQKQISHKKQRLGPGSIPHGRTDYSTAIKIKAILQA